MLAGYWIARNGKTICSRVSVNNTAVDGVGDVHTHLGQLAHGLFEEAPKTKALLHALASAYFSEVPCTIPYLIGCLAELYEAILGERTHI